VQIITKQNKRKSLCLEPDDSLGDSTHHPSGFASLLIALKRIVSLFHSGDGREKPGESGEREGELLSERLHGIMGTHRRILPMNADKHLAVRGIHSGRIRDETRLISEVYLDIKASRLIDDALLKCITFGHGRL